MATVDKKMLDQLAKWWRGESSEYQSVLYVNSLDQALTRATVRKLMYKIDEKDIHGDEYVAVYSAENFRKRMKDYYFEVARIYRRDPDENTPVEEVVHSLPHTCGWLTLIIEDWEELSGRSDVMDKMLHTLFLFAALGANVLLIGHGAFQDVFASSGYATSAGPDQARIAEIADYLILEVYNQESLPEAETDAFQPLEAVRKELCFYWDTFQVQMEHQYFDYIGIKMLLRDTWSYLRPRITAKKLHRNDIALIENIGAFKRVRKETQVDGCKPWEFDAALQIVDGLDLAIQNVENKNSDFSSGEILIWTRVDTRSMSHGVIECSGCTYSTKRFCLESLSERMDKFAEAIHQSAYIGDELTADKLMNTIPGYGATPVNDAETEELFQKLQALQKGIKKAADDTVNKEPGRKVRRYKSGSTSDN